MITVSGLVQRETASIAAASGRHRNVTSDALMSFALSTGSLRSSLSILSTSISFLPSNLSKIRSPVVPSLPSINTFFFSIALPQMNIYTPLYTFVCICQQKHLLVMWE